MLYELDETQLLGRSQAVFCTVRLAATEQSSAINHDAVKET